MDDGAAPPEPDYSLIPLQERCVDKNWKARLSAYTELTLKFSKTSGDDDPFFRPYLSADLLRSWATDTNAAAQEKGLEALCSLIRESGENSARTRGDVMGGVVDKGFISTRAGTKAKAIEVALLYIEVENDGSGVVSDVLRGLDAKQPKLVATTVTCLREIVHAFGIKPLGDVKVLIKALVKIFNHNDKAVRSEGTLLAQALYRYLGPALLPSLADLKPVQQKELGEGFAQLDSAGEGAGTGKATRLTRREKRVEEEKAAAGTGDADDEAATADEPQAMDPLDLIEAVDVVPLFPDNFHSVITSKIWKEKVELLAECAKILESNPKIKDVPALGDIATALGQRMTDTNVNVVSASAGVLATLAQGVEGKGFGKHKGVIVPPILDRLKEKKTMEALGKTLDAVFETVSFADVTGDCVTALQNKNPVARQGTLQFLARALQNTRDAPTKSDLDVIAPAIVGQLGDSLEPVRSAAAEGLGCLSKIFGERPMNPYLENITDAQKTKVTEATGKVEVKCKAGTKAAPKPAPATAAAAPPKSTGPKIPARLAARFGAKPSEVSASSEEKAPEPVQTVPSRPPSVTAISKPISSHVSNEEVGDALAAPTPLKKAGPPARLMARAAPPAAKKPAPAAAKPVAKSGAGKAAPAPVSYDVKYKFAPEDALAKAAEVVPDDIQTGFKSGAWKERLEAADKMTAWIQSDEGAEADSEVLFRYLSTSPGWGEKNFQVSSKVFAIMAELAQKSSSFGKSSAAQAIGPLTDKLGDIKLKKPAGEALIVFAEKTSLGFVLSQAYDSMTKQKAPKAQADALTWVKQAIIDFGIKGLALKDVINFLKVGLQSSNGTVRSSATAALVTLKLFVQTDLSMFLEELNPTLLATINGEFDKIAGQTAPEPTRESEDLASLGDAGSADPAVGGDPMDDLIPRVDLNKVVATTTVLKDSRSENWRVRKEAFEALEAELDRNTRLKPEMGEIGQALKLRMDDSNIAVKLLCLRIISKIATGMGQPFQAHARLFSSPIATICGDQKVTTRNAAVETLTSIADACRSIDAMVPGFASSLEKPNPVLRGCVLAFVASMFANYAPKSDLAPLLPSTLASLEDRNGDVRKAAQALLPFILQSVGYDHVMGQVSKLKPASKSTVTPLVQAARAALAASAPKTSPEEIKPTTKSIETKQPATRPAAKSVLTESNSVPTSMGSQPTLPSAGGSAATPLRARVEPVRPRGMQMKNNALRAPGATLPDSSDHRLPAPTRSLAGGAAGLVRSLGKRPTAPVAEMPLQDSATAAPFHTTDIAPKTQREKRDLARWTYDVNNLSPLVENLQKQMTDHASAEVLTLLFSRDRFAEKDHTAGLAIIDDLYSAEEDDTPFDLFPEVAQSIRIANRDLALKYAGIRLHDGSTQMVIKCLDLVQHIVESVDRARAGFTEAEGNVIVPALIYRLGDNKYKDKLAAIFGLIDRTMPASRVMQLYVDYGIASSSSKTRAAAMEQLAQLIRRRGDVAASATNATKTYRRIAEFISSADSATRSAALDCIAYMYQHTGNNVLSMIGELPPKERDLLKNRIDKMALGTGAAASAASPTPPRSTVPAKTAHIANGTASTPKSEDGVPSTASSPVPQRKAAALSSKIPPNNGVPKLARTGRIVSSDSTNSATGREPHFRPLVASSSVESHSDSRSFEHENSRIRRSVHTIEDNNPDVSVDALKNVQKLLLEAPDEIIPYSNDLMQAIASRLQVVFRNPSTISEAPSFRLTKHLIQTLSNFCDHPHLVEIISGTNLRLLIRQLSLGLLLTDTADGKLKDMSRFMNMSILRLFATGQRIAIFDALFKLLQALALELTEGDSEQDFKAKHAELILKCIWKRSRTTEDDLRKGIITEEDIFTIIEEFLQVITPKQWRIRAAKKVPLGDMPLRTVKVLIQHTIAAIGQDGVMDCLRGIYGDILESTHVYTYVYKITHSPMEDAIPPPSKEPVPIRSKTPIESYSAPPSASEGVLIDVGEVPSTSRASRQSGLIEDDLDRQLEDMINRAALPRTTGSGSQELATLLQAHPEKHGKYEEILNAILGTNPYRLYVKRSVDRRLQERNDVAITPVSPKKTSPKLVQKRQSLAPGPPIPADADADTQLAMLKDKFQFLTSAGNQEEIHPDP